MPSTTEILNLLTLMAHELEWLAVTWHALLLALASPLLARRYPSQRQVLLFLAVLAASVASAAFLFRNPFNATTFAVLAFALLVPGVLRKPRPLRRGPTWAVAGGVALVLYGWCYPHFVDGPWYRSLYAAPLGVVPCPTLAAIAGVTLVSGGFGSSAVPGVVAIWSAFYALFGIFRLGVYLDAGLLLSAALLIALTLIQRRRGAATM